MHHLQNSNGHDIWGCTHKNSSQEQLRRRLNQARELKIKRMCHDNCLRPNGNAWKHYNEIPVSQEKVMSVDINKSWINHIKDNIWVADTGAMTHMMKIKEGFVHIRPEENKMTFAVDKGNMHCKFAGTWKGREYMVAKVSKSVKPGMSLFMHGTLYLPELVVNLFNINKARHMGARLFEKEVPMKH